MHVTARRMASNSLDSEIVGCCAPPACGLLSSLLQIDAYRNLCVGLYTVQSGVRMHVTARRMAVIHWIHRPVCAPPACGLLSSHTKPYVEVGRFSPKSICPRGRQREIFGGKPICASHCMHYLCISHFTGKNNRF